MNTGFGYGKIILLGEHFVVHGLSAIVAALGLGTEAKIEPIDTTTTSTTQTNSSSIQIIDNRPKIPSYKPLKSKEYERMVLAVFAAMGVKPSCLRITFSGTLPVTNGGIGASAAAAVSLARAISNTFKLNYPDTQINQAAFAGEREIHGNPSGIDNTAATFGGMFVFNRSVGLLGGCRGEHTRVERPTLNNQGPLHLIIADSGRSTNTKQILTAVSAFKSQNPTQTNALFDRYLKVFEQAKTALQNNDLVSLGKAMSQNHRILQDLGVSSPELDYLVSCAQKAGALGAKLTGTGCGGVMIALAPDLQTQEYIAHTLRTEGFFTITQNIDVQLPYDFAHTQSNRIEIRP